MSLATELAHLCEACGLCCDGTIFAVGSLEPSEVSVAKRAGLRVLSDAAFAIPCPAREPGGCAAYEQRPSVCRRYECRLRQTHASGQGDLATKLAVVRSTRRVAERLRANLPDAQTSLVQRIEKLRKMSAEDWLGADPARALDIVELAVRLERDFGIAVERGSKPTATMGEEPNE